MKNLALALLLLPLFEGAGVAAVVQSCPSTMPLQLAATGCRLGTAIAAVDAVGGATYSWTIEGGTLLSGGGSERIVVALGSGAALKVSVLISSASCGAQTATGIMALHDPFAVKSFDVAGGTHAGQPRALTWSFQNGAPVTQTLTGTDFAPVILSASARSYTYTPSLYGDKSVVLDASTSTVPPPARLRAVGRGGAPASSCSSARAEAKFHVDCNTPDAAIVAPAATGVGLPFTASVKLPAGTSAAWTIANGAPATATGASVSIVPTGGAPVDVHVTVTAGTCTAASAAQVKVDSALGCAIVPQATLALTSSDCDKGVISVHLAGTPPFTGTWSDGEPFAALDFTAERTVNAAGDYTIKNFRDAFCPGHAATLTAVLKPTATLATGGNACIGAGDATAVVTFSGTPPFAGEWSDGVAFNTTGTRLERKIAAPVDLTLKSFRDAKCDGVVSGHAAFGAPGTASVRLVSPANGCLAYTDGIPTAATVAVDLTGTPPFTLQWSDGSTQTANTPAATRFFAPSLGTVASLTLTGARDAYCGLQIANAKVTVAATTAPQLSLPDQYPLCPDLAATVSLKSFIMPGSKITWRIDNGGAIVSGQGSSTVGFIVPAGAGSATLSVDVADPNTCTVTATAREFLALPSGPIGLKVNATTINLGQSLTFTTTIDPARNNFTGMQVDSPYWERFGDCWYDASCTITYTPRSAGIYKFTAFASAWCPSLPVATTSLQVTVK